MRRITSMDRAGARRSVGRLSTGLLVAVMVVVGASCGGDDGGGAEGPGAGSAVGSTGTAASDGAVTGDHDPNARFRWANGVGLTRFDPHRASSSNDNTHLFLTYDRLIHQDSAGDPVPGLAESWEFLDDGLVLELRLREGVTFHDGTPFDAAAVKANIERAQTVEGSAVVSELTSIQSIEIDGDLIVRLDLLAPNAALPLILSDRAGAMVSPAAFDDPELDRRPVGAGMYTVSSYVPGSEITYEAYPDYWDPDAVKVAGIDMLIMADSNVRLNALRSGQVDATTLAPQLVEQAESAGLRVTLGRTNNYWYFQPNRARSEFGDVRVRQAIWHAIDRQGLVDNLALGNGTLSSQPVPDWSFAHNPDIPADLYPYDPARARELLAEAGLPDGFSFEALVATSNEVELHAAAIQAYLAEVGIDMSIRSLDGEQITDVFFVQGEGDLLMGPGGGRPDPAQTTALRYLPDGFMNPGGHTTDEIERLQTAVIETVDVDERAAAFRELLQVVADEALEVILYFATPPIGSTDRVMGFDPQLADRPEFRGVAIAAE